MTQKFTLSPTSPYPALGKAAATSQNPAPTNNAPPSTSPNPAPSTNAPPSYYQSPIKPDNFFYVFLLYR